jgi:putative transposase
MPTKRVVLPGRPHHVILRGNNRRRLFSYPSDYKRFLWDVWRAQRKRPVAIHALTLMKNHVHLVVTPPDSETLARFIHGFAQRYAQLRNARRAASGKLFEQRYISIPILSERQLAVTIAYVELNPIRAGICEDPSKYQWSTYGLHVPGSGSCAIPEQVWTPSDWYLGLADEPELRSSLYAQFVRGCRDRDEAPERVEQVRLVEALSSTPYTRRLERPNRRRAI